MGHSKKQWISLNKASEDVFMTLFVGKVVSKGISGMCICLKSEHFGPAQAQLHYFLRNKFEGKNGESASCSVPFLCSPGADVVSRRKG